MAKQNPGDILTCDWNPVVGCARFSAGCRHCWWLDGVMPWQKRLGNLPAGLVEGVPAVLDARLDPAKLRPKRGLVGVVQHGDLFWDAVSDAVIHQVLDVVDQVAGERAARNQRRTTRDLAPDETKYVLWTKRARRLADFLGARYPAGVPSHLACGVSVENQALADERLPHLLRIQGHRLVMIEPMLGPVDLTAFPEVSWVVLGSETGAGGPRPMPLEWARPVRDWAQARGIPFFLKQVGPDHRRPERRLDGRTWDEFPPGFRK
jgi:protein gp37